MIKIKIDTSDVEATEARARAEFANLKADMQARIARGAAQERASHRYQNRTGNLESSTQAVTRSAGSSSVEISLEMGMTYASYVKNHGFSNIDEIAEGVADDLTEYFEELANKISDGR